MGKTSPKQTVDIYKCLMVKDMIENEWWKDDTLYKVDYKGKQPKYLHRFLKDGDYIHSYCGTYEILHLTEVNGREYALLKRTENNVFEYIRYTEQRKDKVGDVFIAEFHLLDWDRAELYPPERGYAEVVIREFEKLNGKGDS